MEYAFWTFSEAWIIDMKYSHITKSIYFPAINMSSLTQFLCLILFLLASPVHAEEPGTIEADDATSIEQEQTNTPNEGSWFPEKWLPKSWLPKSVQIHGFLSQGMTITSDNNFFGNSDDSVSFDFRELGLNGSWRIIPELQISAQVVYRDAGLTDNSDIRLDYALADYNFYSSEATTLGVRGGRVPTPFGFYNDTRDVASTRPGIILPQSIYFDRNRNIALSADGGYIYGEQRTSIGDFYLQAGAIIPRGNDDPEFKNSVVGSLPGKMKGKVSWATRLNYEWRGGLVRLAFSAAELNIKYNPDPGTVNLQPGTFTLHPILFSAQYNAEDWSLTAEYEIRNVRLKNFGFPNIDQTGNSFYVQGIYHFTTKLQGMVRYDHLILNNKDKNGERFAAATGNPAFSRFAKDWTFGLRYEIFPNMLISAEYHNIEGTGWISKLENPDPSKTSKYWNLYMMMISYDF
jgi:hypothetical protein